MTNFSLLIFTAVAVSIDSFVVGFGVSLDKKSNLSLPSAVAIATLLLCIATSLLGAILQKYLADYVDYLSALLLLWLALESLFEKEGLQPLNNLSLKECFAVGFTVGLDGAVANLTLYLDNFGLIAPLVITVAHFVAVLLGQNLASKLQLAKTNKLSAFTLVALALTKLL